jgi:hypothetical protein
VGSGGFPATDPVCRDDPPRIEVCEGAVRVETEAERSVALPDGQGGQGGGGGAGSVRLVVPVCHPLSSGGRAASEVRVAPGQRVNVTNRTADEGCAEASGSGVEVLADADGLLPLQPGLFSVITLPEDELLCVEHARLGAGSGCPSN